MTKKRKTRGGTSRKRGSRRSSRKRSGNRIGISLNTTQKVLLAGFALIFFAGILILSLLSPNQGELTSFLSTLLGQAFGWGRLVAPVLLAAAGFYLVLWGMEQAPELPKFRLLGLVLLLFTLEGFASLAGVVLDNGLLTVWDVARAESGGGYLGGGLAWGFSQFVGQAGAILLLAITGTVATILLFGVTRDEFLEFVQELWALRPERAAATAGDRSSNGERQSASRRPRPETPPIPAAAEAEAEGAGTTAEKVAQPSRREQEEETAPDEAEDEIAVFMGSTNGIDGHSWELPEMDELLEPGGPQEISNATIREQVQVIEHTLESFGAPAQVVEINQGPTITQFGVEPQFIERRNGKRTKVKVGKIASLADDLALALAAHSVRVEAPVPGKGYVGLEVPNPQKALVSLRDVMEAPALTRIRSPLRIGLGQNVSGQAIAADLAKMPHLLIAGATGSGKSVCVNSIIACLLLQNTPEMLRMVMVDPKRVELTGYNGIPHLVAPVVVDMERVIATLQWALREMDMRYQKLAEIGARNIRDYNRKVQGTDRKHMPYVVIVIDELADLMMVSPDETERSVTRLAQMARATGIHMVIATQRPSVDVVTGLIKANFPARIAFAVASGTDSRVILDTTGAERLLGQGDMLFQSPDAGAVVRLQGSFVSDTELTRLIRYWQQLRRQNRIAAKDARREKQEEKQQQAKAKQETPSIPPPTQQPLWEDLIEEAQQEPEYEDELIPEAIALVRELGKASTSLLQRRFRIGYTRAARIMDVMEEEEIIGPPTGTSKAREVLDFGEQGEEDAGSPPADATDNGEEEP